jgi:hypothetical protein
MEGYPGFYYSADYGETIELRDSVVAPEDFFGGLLKDKSDSTLYRVLDNNFNSLYISTNGGYNWDLVEFLALSDCYGSGIIPGELYRRIDENHSRIERSENYGEDFTPCACNGFPDSVWVYSVALGYDSGDIYIWTIEGYLYYSNNHGASFTFQGDMYNTYGISPYSKIINGAVTSEIFAISRDWWEVWQISLYGFCASEIIDLNVNIGWLFSVASTREPGELYLLIKRADPIRGGIIQIYHTFDYFQHWTMITHHIGETEVEQTKDNYIPHDITVHVYPNPTNTAFNISYELNATQDIRLMMYDVLGRQVRRNDIDTQSPGIHHLSFASDHPPSGQYFLILQSQQGQITQTITIIK